MATPHSLVWNALDAEDFAPAPLPAHLFPRDNSCWVYDRLPLPPDVRRRRRETPRSLGSYIGPVAHTVLQYAVAPVAPVAVVPHD